MRNMMAEQEAGTVVKSQDAYGNWTNSKIWISEQETVRMSFARMQESTRKNGFGHSPALPQNVGQYGTYLVECKAAKIRALQRKIASKEAAANHQRPAVMKLYNGKQFDDGLSAVLGMPSAFNPIMVGPVLEHEQIDWPPASEYTKQREFYGNKAASLRQRAMWPFPRLNTPFHYDVIFPKGVTIPYGDRKMILAPRWDWISPLARRILYGNRDKNQIFVGQVRPIVAQLLNDIDSLDME